MGLVEVDIIGPESTERTVDGRKDVLAGQPAVVGAWSGREVHLCRDLNALAPSPAERDAKNGFRAGAGVDIGGVKRGDAKVKRGVNTGLRRLLIAPVSVGHPVAIGDLGDVHP